MHDPEKTATFAELAADIFVLALRVRSGPCGDPFEAVRSGTLRLFEVFEQRAKARHADASDLSTAKYGLAAFLDEAVLNSEWPGREQWADEPLQLRYFNTYVAGGGFFDKLDAVRAQDPPNPELLELYHLCLTLGFRGKYGVEGPERLQALVKVLDGELERMRPVSGQDLSPRWLPSDERARSAASVPRALLVGCAAVVGATLLTYGFLLMRIRL